jgi:hypothetical protein
MLSVGAFAFTPARGTDAAGMNEPEPKLRVPNRRGQNISAQPFVYYFRRRARTQRVGGKRREIDFYLCIAALFLTSWREINYHRLSLIFFLSLSPAFAVV